MSNDAWMGLLSIVALFSMISAYSIKIYDWYAQRKAKKRMDEFVRWMTE
jgi:hypothetical protein